MLVLTDSLPIEGATVYRDAAITQGVRSYSNVFYVLEDAPRIATEEDGGPAAYFLWYRAEPPAPPGAEGGGFLTLSVDFSLKAARESDVKAAVAAAFGLAPEEVILRSMPAASASLTLAFAGETEAEGGEFVKRLGGATTIAMGGRQRGSFAIHLTSDGAALASALFEESAPLCFARCELSFEHRLVGATLRAFCDAKRSHAVAERTIRAGAVDIATLRRTLIDEHAAGVVIESETVLPEEQRLELEKTGLSILESMLASTFFEPKTPHNEEGLAPALRAYDESFEASLNVTLSGTYPILSRATIEGPLSLSLTDESRAKRVTRVDLEGAGFPIHEVQIVCTAEPGASLLDAVSVSVEYDETGPRGRVHRTKDLLFKKGSPSVATFRTDLAAPDKRTCRYAAAIHYEGDPDPLHLDLLSTDSRLVVLDVDALGVLSVDIALRDVPREVRSAVFELEYAPREGPPVKRIVVLDHDSPEARIQIAVRESPLSPYRYQVTYHLSDERRVVSPPVESTSSRLWLDLPGQIHRKLRVELIAAGDYSALANVVVELRAGPDAPIEEVVLTESGQRATVALPGEDLTSLRYEVRQTLVYRDGVRKTVDFSAEERTILLIRDVLRFSVRVVSRLLDLGGESGFALLSLSHEGEGMQKQQATLVLRSPSEEPVWSFRLSRPDAHAFRYMLTLVRRDGSRIEGPLLDADEEILVLVPPSA